MPQLRLRRSAVPVFSALVATCVAPTLFLLPSSTGRRCNGPWTRTVGFKRQGARCLVGQRSQGRIAEAPHDGPDSDTPSSSMNARDPMLQMASRLLPDNERLGVWALYAWCRRADDVCDAPTPPRSTEERIALLDSIEADLWNLRASRQPKNRVDEELLRTMDLWPSLDEQLFSDMLQGMRAELRCARFAAFEPDLRRYAYCVAGTVGLMLLPVLGAREPSQELRGRAVDLGIAVQLTNILRDVGHDAALGRIFLPQEDLARFGVEEADVLQRRLTPAYRELIRFEVERAHGYFASARIGADLLPRRSQLMVLAVIRLLDGLLDELLVRDCDNMGGKIKLSTWDKIRHLSSAVAEWLLLGLPAPLGGTKVMATETMSGSRTPFKT